MAMRKSLMRCSTERCGEKPPIVKPTSNVCQIRRSTATPACLDNERRHGCGQHEHGSARREVREFEQLAFAMVVAAHFGSRMRSAGAHEAVPLRQAGAGGSARSSRQTRRARGARTSRRAGRVERGAGRWGTRDTETGRRSGKRGRLSRLNGWVGHGRVGRERGCVGKSEGRVGRGRVVRASGLSGCRSHRRLVGCGAGRQSDADEERTGGCGMLLLSSAMTSIRNGPCEIATPGNKQKGFAATAAASIRSRT